MLYFEISFFRHSFFFVHLPVLHSTDLESVRVKKNEMHKKTSNQNVETGKKTVKISVFMTFLTKFVTFTRKIKKSFDSEQFTRLKNVGKIGTQKDPS